MTRRRGRPPRVVPGEKRPCHTTGCTGNALRGSAYCHQCRFNSGQVEMMAAYDAARRFREIWPRPQRG